MGSQGWSVSLRRTDGHRELGQEGRQRRWRKVGDFQRHLGIATTCHAQIGGGAAGVAGLVSGPALRWDPGPARNPEDDRGGGKSITSILSALNPSHDVHVQMLSSSRVHRSCWRGIRIREAASFEGWLELWSRTRFLREAVQGEKRRSRGAEV